MKLVVAQKKIEQHKLNLLELESAINMNDSDIKRILTTLYQEIKIGLTTYDNKQQHLNLVLLSINTCLERKTIKNILILKKFF